MEWIFNTMDMIDLQNYHFNTQVNKKMRINVRIIIIWILEMMCFTLYTKSCLKLVMCDARAEQTTVIFDKTMVDVLEGGITCF